VEPIPYQVSKADYMDVFVVARLPLFAKMLALLTVLFALLDLVPLYLSCGCTAMTLPRIASGLLTAAVPGAIICGSLLLLCWLSARALARTLEKIGQGTSMAWDDEALHIRTQFGSDSYPWAMFEKWNETRRVLLLSLTRMHVFHFPKRDFSEEQLDALRAQIVQAGVRKPSS